MSTPSWQLEPQELCDGDGVAHLPEPDLVANDLVITSEATALCGHTTAELQADSLENPGSRAPSKPNYATSRIGAASDEGDAPVSACNAPAQEPPQNLKLAPAEYLIPSDRALVTSVTTSREGPDVLDHEKPRKFTSIVQAMPPGPLPRPSQDIRDLDMKCASSIFYNARGDGRVLRISERCKFLPDEQQRLICFRQKLAQCVEELQALHQLLGPKGSPVAGLPELHDVQRCRFRGRFFDATSAQKDLCNTQLLEKLKQYIAFVDYSLDETRAPILTGIHRPPCRPTSTLSPIPRREILNSTDGRRLQNVRKTPKIGPLFQI